MVSKYWLLMKSEDGRLIRYDSYGIINESGQEDADCEAMACMGRRLMDEASALRRMRTAKTAEVKIDQKLLDGLAALLGSH